MIRTFDSGVFADLPIFPFPRAAKPRFAVCSIGIHLHTSQCELRIINAAAEVGRYNSPKKGSLQCPKARRFQSECLPRLRKHSRKQRHKIIEAWRRWSSKSSWNGSNRKNCYRFQGGGSEETETSRYSGSVSIEIVRINFSNLLPQFIYITA